MTTEWQPQPALSASASLAPDGDLRSLRPQGWSDKRQPGCRSTPRRTRGGARLRRSRRLFRAAIKRLEYAERARERAQSNGKGALQAGRLTTAAEGQAAVPTRSRAAQRAARRTKQSRGSDRQGTRRPRERTGCDSRCDAEVSWTKSPPGRRTRATS